MFDAYWNYCQISDGVLYYTGLRPTENEVHSMNKTFKIVFNKARGALMVANEITGSVQKKGVRVAIATATLLALGSLSNVAAAYNTIENQTFSENITFNQGCGWSLVVNENLTSKNNSYSIIASLPDSLTVFDHNDSPAGTVYYLYSNQDGKYTANFERDSFVGNEMHVGSSTAEGKGEWAVGGALNIKGYTANFKDTLFKDNKVIATTSGGGVAAVGGAVALDKTINTTSANTVANFIFSKDMSYTGNTVSNSNEAASTTVYGGRAYTSGGFLFMDRASTANFDVAEGATFTLGIKNNADKHADTIASSLTSDSDAKKNGGHNRITKQGAGTFVINSSLNNYNGLVDVLEGSMVVNSDWKIRNAVTISGGTLDLSNSDFNFSSIAGCATDLDPGITVASTAKGSLTLQSGTLIAKIGNVFNDAEGDATLDSTEVTKTKDGFTFKSGTLALSDSGTYGADLYNSIVDQIKNPNVVLNFMNATLAANNNAPLEIRHNTSVAGISGEDLKIISAKLSIAGKNQSSLGTVELRDGGALAAKDNATVQIDTLSGMGKVSVGEYEGTNAHMVINTLNMDAGSIFIDPYYGESTLTVASLNDDELNTNVTAGTGALVTFGTDVASAKNAVAKLDGFSALQSVVYVGTSMTLGASGSIVIKPLATAADETHAKKVYVASNGGLVIDQSAVGSNTVFAGAEEVTFEGGSKLGITNATVGTITLTDAARTVVDDITTATTDNPFVEATVDGNTIVNTMSAEGGLGALASTGIQAMTRRADTVLAQTIADRTSVDQELAAGTNLWVDVTSERYEADKLDNGGKFKSDMGYGAFGADFAVTQDITAGAAFQYGKGSLRSGVSSIKNSIDSYGVTAYGAMKFGDAKVVAEASYIKNENDITSSQTALNQSVDSEIYSVGVRGQHRFTAGNFQFVPSVGVRVSRLNTDAMQVGAVNIKKQEQTLVQVPIALRVNGFEQNVSGWSVAPSFKVAYVPTFGDKEISVFGADQTVIDTSPVQGDFGIRAQNGNLMVNANMMLGGGKDGTSSVGGKVGLKYVF